MGRRRAVERAEAGDLIAPGLVLEYLEEGVESPEWGPGTSSGIQEDLGAGSAGTPDLES